MRVDGDRSIKPQAIRDLEALGVKVELPQELFATHEEDGSVEVDADNWDAVRLFLALGGQWRTVPVTGKGGRVHLLRTGLDYGGLDVFARGYGIAVDGPVLDALQVLEAESVELFQVRLKQSFNGS